MELHAWRKHGVRTTWQVTDVDSIDRRDDNGLFGEPINYDQDGVETRGRREFLDKSIEIEFQGCSGIGSCLRRL